MSTPPATLAAQSPDAIVIRDATKRFKKSTVRHEYTTLKSELMNLLIGRKPAGGKPQFIEALRGIDLVIPRGKTVGVLGRNGSGKSTLLKLVTGIYAPTTGDIAVNGRVSALLDLGAGFHPDFSGRENILINGIILGMSRAEVRARMDEIIAFSELGEFIDEPVRSYSSGMYMRLAFAVATHVDPDILIIDEILAVGDEHFAKKSMARMTQFKQSGRTIVLVTHDLGTVERWCDLAVWIDGGRVREMGPPPTVVANYREAVRLAEISEKPFTPPALSLDGGALPGLQAAQPQDVPAHLPPVVAALRVTDRKGAEVESMDSEHGCLVQLSVRSETASGSGAIVVEVLSDSGVLIFRTSTTIDGVVVPSPLPAKLDLTLDIERLGLVPGQYTVQAHVLEAGGGPPSEKARANLKVTSATVDAGLYRPRHCWTLPGAEGVPRRREKTAGA